MDVLKAPDDAGCYAWTSGDLAMCAVPLRAIAVRSRRVWAQRLASPAGSPEARR